MSDAENLLRTYVRDAHGRVPAKEPAPQESGFRTRSLVCEVARVNLGVESESSVIRRASAGISAEDAAQEIMSRCGATASGDYFSILTEAEDLPISRFPGALQRSFLTAGFGLDDLKAGLSWAVERGLLSVGKRYGMAGEVQTYAAVTKAASQIEE